MSIRGIDLIELLLKNANGDTENAQSPTIGSRIGQSGVAGTYASSLDIKAIAAYLAMDKSTRLNTGPATGRGSNDVAVDFDIGDFDMWMQSLDVPLMY